MCKCKAPGSFSAKILVAAYDRSPLCNRGLTDLNADVEQGGLVVRGCDL